MDREQRSDRPRVREALDKLDGFDWLATAHSTRFIAPSVITTKKIVTGRMDPQMCGQLAGSPESCSNGRVDLLFND